jgi:hypothetical protein
VILTYPKDISDCANGAGTRARHEQLQAMRGFAPI